MNIDEYGQISAMKSIDNESQPKQNNTYNMVCSALFLQRALYTVHCTNIMRSRKPSFVIIPTVFS